MAQFEGQSEKVARRVWMPYMFRAELEVRRSPSEQLAAPFTIWFHELAPSREALLVAMSLACRQKSGMAALLRLLPNDRVASELRLLVETGASSEEAFGISGVDVCWSCRWWLDYDDVRNWSW